MIADLLNILAEFGAAGLIGVLWLAERRASAGRERQLEQAHARIASSEGDREALIAVVRENTRAIAALETSQRELLAHLRQRDLINSASAGASSSARPEPVQVGYPFQNR